MDITELENDCKKESRKVFEEFKRCVINHPFVGILIDQDLIEDAIEFQIKQKFGSKILDKYMTQFSTEEQMQFLTDTVAKYKLQLLAVANNWSKKMIGK